MTRGELYLVSKPGSRDRRKQWVFAVVSRQVLLDSQFSTAICAPVYSAHDGLLTQGRVGVEEGLKHESSLHCDELVRLRKTMLPNYVGRMSPVKMRLVERALRVALEMGE